MYRNRNRKGAKIALVMLKIAAFVFLAIFIFDAASTGISETERGECKEWQRQAARYPAFEATQWQKDQCNNYKMAL